MTTTIYSDDYLEQWGAVFIARDLHRQFGVRFEDFIQAPERFLKAEQAFGELCALLTDIRRDAPVEPWPETAGKRGGELGAGLVWYRGPRLANPMPRRLQARPVGQLRRVHLARPAAGGQDLTGFQNLSGLKAGGVA